MIDATLALLGRATIAVTIAVVVVLASRVVLRRLVGARRAYALWLAVPLALGVMLLPRAPAPVTVDRPAVTTVSRASPTDVVTPRAAPTWPAWLVGAWGVGTLAFATLLVVRQRRFRRALRHDADAIGPAVVGAWRARIVLPSDFDIRYDATERALVLAHERTHLARRDGLANLVANVLLLPFWFHPLLHVAMRCFRHDQELACDASVLAAHPGQARAYASAMLKTQHLALPSPVACHWHSRHPIVERIAMLNQRLPRRSHRVAGTVLMIAALAGASGVIHAVQPRATPTPMADGAAAALTENAGDVVAYRIALVLSLDGKPAANAALVSRIGHDATISGHDAAGRFWRAHLTATPTMDDRWAIGASIEREREGNVVATPSLWVEGGKPASIEIADDRGGSHFKLDVTVFPVDLAELLELESSPRAPAAVVAPVAASAATTASARAPAADVAAIRAVRAGSTTPVARANDAIAPTAPTAPTPAGTPVESIAPTAPTRSMPVRAGNPAPAPSAAPTPSPSRADVTRFRELRMGSSSPWAASLLDEVVAGPQC